MHYVKSPEILREVAENLEKAAEKLEKVKVLDEKKKEKLIKLLKDASRNFMELSANVEVDNVEMAEFLRKRSVEIKNNCSDRDIERIGEKEFTNKIERMNLYSRTAFYDFQRSMLLKLKRFYRAFIFGMALYFVLAGLSTRPELAITALILAIPTILAMLSLQRRGYTGLMLAYAVAPIPIIQSAMLIRLFYSVVTNPEAIRKAAEALGKSEGFVVAYSYAVIVLSFVDFLLLSYGLYGLAKHRDAFL
ncbi:Alpha glucosidase [Pyrococcus abyssi GE5]|uniref:Alpha glucosidase n=1 Tax=Pyrococcus abyssi (strain GE5 / Orsay) TaxID=272844 RepID=Q9V0L4_PYRAB|nr:alkaline-shock protein [Pyrococcus abyssi]CAB49689.1 Alpha glucosidase [Pyrococcus abyssi GE5]